MGDLGIEPVDGAAEIAGGGCDAAEVGGAADAGVEWPGESSPAMADWF